MATVGAVGWASLEAIWVPGADWPQRPELGTQNLSATELGKSGVILLAPSSGFTQGQAAVFWDSDAGKQLRRIDGEGVFFGGDHLVDLRNTDQTLRIWNLRGVKSPEDVKTLMPDLRQIVLPGSTFDVNSYIENDSLVIEDIKNHAYRIYDLTKPAEAITANSIEINKVHFSPVVGRTKEYLFATSASHNSQNQWQLSILPKELGIADLSLEDELTYIGFKEAEEETELVVLTKSAQDTNIENFKILTKQIKSLGKRSLAIPSSLVSSFGRDIRYGFLGDLFIHYTLFESTLEFDTLYRDGDFRLLDWVHDNDARSGFTSGQKSSLAYIISNDGVIRFWNNEGQLQGRLETGSKYERGAQVVLRSSGNYAVIYDPEEKRIIIWNIVTKKQTASIAADDINGISAGGNDDEFAVSMPTATIEMFKVDGRSLGVVSGIEGGPISVTRGYCSATIWTNRGQVLRVFRKWQVFGFLKFGRGDCPDDGNRA